MDTMRITIRAAGGRRELARQLRELATALNNELEHADHGPILTADGLNAGRWSIAGTTPAEARA